jgi:hypothetical protein
MSTAWLIDRTNARGARTVHASEAPIDVVEAYFEASMRRVAPRHYRAETPAEGERAASVEDVWVSELAGSVVVGDDRPRPGELTRIVVESWPAGHPVP